MLIEKLTEDLPPERERRMIQKIHPDSSLSVPSPIQKVVRMHVRGVWKPDLVCKTEGSENGVRRITFRACRPEGGLAPHLLRGVRRRGRHLRTFCRKHTGVPVRRFQPSLSCSLAFKFSWWMRDLLDDGGYSDSRSNPDETARPDTIVLDSVSELA